MLSCNHPQIPKVTSTASGITPGCSYESMHTCMLQWIGLLLVLMLVNFVFVRFRRKSPVYERLYGSETDPILMPSSGPVLSRDAEESFTLSRDLEGSLKELKL